MKKLLLLAGLLSVSAASAQITVTHDGIPFEEGEVFTFTTLDPEDAKLHILTTNEGETATYVQIRVDEITGNTAGPDMGTNLQLCYHELCFNTISEGTVIPDMINIGLALLEPGQSNELADHFYNTNPGDGENPVEYSFTVIEVDEEGNVLNEIISFGYKYQSTMDTDNFEALKNMGIVVNNTVIKNNLNITATANATVQLYDITGKLVTTAKIENGSQAIDLSGLNSAVYIAKFKTEDNRASQIKIVKN